MTLEQLEQAFSGHSAEIVKNQDGSRTVTFETTQGALYPITFLEEWSGGVRASFKFPTSVAIPVQEGVELARRLNAWVKKAALISYEPDHRFFYADRVISAADAWEDDINWFLTACDLLRPLFAKVARTGSWDDWLIQLAFVSRSDETTIH